MLATSIWNFLYRAEVLFTRVRTNAWRDLVEGQHVDEIRRETVSYHC